MVSQRILPNHNASNGVIFVARRLAVFFAQYLNWTASQPRELRADANLKRDAKLIVRGTLFVLFLVIFCILQNDVTMAIGCAITWIGALVHLGRRLICINIARLLLRFFSPLVISVHSSSVLMAAESYISRNITPLVQPPRL